jgi:uncharacterized protein YecE (DUF72 family)
LDRLYERLEPLLGSPKLGPILWQLPPTFHRDHERLAQALALLPAGQRHCFEFRHPSWFVEETYALLREYRVALVIADRPDLNEFRTLEHTADWTFVRFHTGGVREDGAYGEAELEDWASRFDDWSHRVEIYAYFNNDWEGFAPANALRLKSLLGLQ